MPAAGKCLLPERHSVSPTSTNTHQFAFSGSTTVNNSGPEGAGALDGSNTTGMLIFDTVQLNANSLIALGNPGSSSVQSAFSGFTAGYNLKYSYQQRTGAEIGTLFAAFIAPEVKLQVGESFSDFTGSRISEVLNPSFSGRPGFASGSVNNPFYRSPGTGPYSQVAGHHVYAKKAFEGAVGYNFREAFSVSADTLTQYGVRHADITGAQSRLFREFSASGAPNTLAHHSRIAYQAMVDAGMPPSVARQLVVESQNRLIRSGVVEPTTIPWETR